MTPTTPWHRASFARFTTDSLPHLLQQCLSLQDYRVDADEPHTCRLHVHFGAVEVVYEIPQPNDEGVFLLDGKEWVVPPLTLAADLQQATVECVGEQLAAFVEQRLPSAIEETPASEEEARALLPLDTWCNDFLAQNAEPMHDINWLDRQTHLRRLLLPNRQDAVPSNHLGLICPIETPEGPNIGSITTIARSAAIENGKLVNKASTAIDHLGLTAAMVPFLEHSDPGRALMGINHMRQWPTTPAAEPALVQTGYEPDAKEFWCGFNLLTAYVSWGVDTFEDGLALSASCAQRLALEHPLEPGDVLSNRHGTKGVVSRILPDDEMPQLADGTVVDIACSFVSLSSRLNFGQIREAVLGRIAKTENKIALAPPFAAPDEAELRTRLQKAGLSEDGREQLRYQGQDLEQRSTVGWVYWGLTIHVARNKMRATTADDLGQRQGDMEFCAMQQAGAYQTIREHYNTRSRNRPDINSLAERVTQGSVEQAPAPTPQCSALMERLQAAGIEMQLSDEDVHFRFADPPANALELACPLPHPWLPEHELTAVGQTTELSAYVGEINSLPQFAELASANSRLQRILASKAPARLREQAKAQLAERLATYIDELVTTVQLRTSDNSSFSGRSVLAPGPDLSYEEIGVPEEIAWTLFSPLLARTLPAAEITARSEAATLALDQLMAGQWIIVSHAPTLAPSGILAFRPVLTPDRAIRLHPLACAFMRADFDVDQAALFLPITEQGQREAGQLLTLAAHIERDPTLIAEQLWRVKLDAMWGLANLSLSPAGREKINGLVGFPVDLVDGIVTEHTISTALTRVFRENGTTALLVACDALLNCGFSAIKASGASIPPFPHTQPAQPPLPTDPTAWEAYAEEVMGQLAQRRDYATDDLGPLCLLSHSGGRSFPLWRHLYKLVGVAADRTALSTGMQAGEYFAAAAQVWQSFHQLHQDVSGSGRTFRLANQPTGFDILARAKRSAKPGIVFARAAHRQATETLTDDYSRLFAGLAVDNK